MRVQVSSGHLRFAQVGTKTGTNFRLVDAFGWIFGLGGLSAGLAGVGLGIDQRRQSREHSQLLEALRRSIVEQAPERADEVARSLRAEPSPVPSPGAEALPPDQREAIADAIVGLPEREKLVLTLYYYEDLARNEIAEILGVRETEVDELLDRALLRLRSRLGEGFPL
jgi:RNA polymerase sigma factor (sigma-70 family)